MDEVDALRGAKRAAWWVRKSTDTRADIGAAGTPYTRANTNKDTDTDTDADSKRAKEDMCDQ